MAHQPCQTPEVIFREPAPAPVVPGTYVEINPDSINQRLYVGSRENRATPDELAPEVALVLAAVLIAAAEQVSSETLALFGAERREDISIHALALAFRGDDSGLTGDVFEWALLLAINSGDEAISSLVADALTLAKSPVVQPQAILVAAERGRLVAFSPQLPEGAVLATGRRGRPPQVANLLREATTATWKSDLLLGSGDKWVGASLKSNPIALSRSMREAAATTSHPPRIGITASSRPALTRDPSSDAIFVHVPVNGSTMAISKMVVADVKEAFERHLSVPDAPLRQDASGIGTQLYRWRNRSLGYVVSVLLDHAAGLRPLAASTVASTGASVSDARGALVVVDTLIPDEDWRYGPPMLYPGSVDRRFGRFSPID